MPKNLFQDIKIKTIPVKTGINKYGNNIANNKKIWESIPQNKIKTEIIKEKEDREDFVKLKDNTGNRFGLWFVALIAVIFLLFALSYLFTKAKITINPKMQDLVLNQNFSATKDNAIDKNNLSFDLVVMSGEETKIVKNVEKKDVSIKATGNVLIYNAFSQNPQTLSIDTRLEGSNGKLYKTDKQITIPGMKNNKPGVIGVGIYADQAGSIGNSSPIDFKILGFKGTSKYEKFYGRSVGEITGGLEGNYSVLSDAEKEITIKELENLLQAKLFQKITDQIPDGFILFKNAVFLDSLENSVGTESSDSNISVTLKGTLYGFLFNQKSLEKSIAEANIEKYDGSEIFIENIKDLNFSLFDKENIFFSNVKDIAFNLSGPFRVIWKVDENRLINDVLSKQKKDFNLILSDYENIDSAELIIRPFWKSSFPDKIKDINVIVNYF